MIWVAGLRARHGDEVAATLRHSFSCSWRDFGDPDSWGELVALVRVAMRDTRTYLGAAVAEFAYPASIPDLLQVKSITGDDAEKWLPHSMREIHDRTHVSPVDEREALEFLRTHSAFADKM